MMKIGMLWFDESREVGVAQRIVRASDYYQSKYGFKPNLCFVHPDTISEGTTLSEVPLKVKASQTILEDHFWIGVEEEVE
jgi:hypothetical protein